MSPEDKNTWTCAADYLKEIRTQIVTGNPPRYCLTAVINQEGNVIISMVGHEDAAAVRSLLEACMNIAGAAELESAQAKDPNRILN